MALTKISGSILKDPLNLGGVSIGGTLTYQDVTNVDSVGLGTFRSGINVSGGQLDVGSNIKLGNAGVITATTFKGDGDFVELDVDGQTNLDHTSIVGIVTISAGVNNEGLRITGQHNNAVIFTSPSINGSAGYRLNHHPSTNFLRVDTTDQNGTFTGTVAKFSSAGLDMADNIKLRLGTNQDLTLYHYGNDAYIDNADGDIIFRQGTSEKVRIASDGVTTVTGELNVINSANTTFKILDSTGTPDSYGYFTYNNGSDADDALIIGVDGGNQQSNSHIRFYVDGTSSSAEKVRITSNGRINIGDTDLTQNTDQLCVSVSANNAVDNVARFQSAAAASGTSESLVKVYKGAGYGGVISGYITQGSDHGMKFYTANNGALTERLRINKSGHVTMPHNPAFHARPPGHYQLNAGPSDTIIGGTWSTGYPESFAQGSLPSGTSIWNNNTGVFTVPVDGVYSIHWNVFLKNNTERRDAMIYLNGTGSGNIIARTEIQQPSGATARNKNVSVHTIVHLSATDEIRFGCLSDGSANRLYQNSKPWSYACAALIG